MLLNFILLRLTRKKQLWSVHTVKEIVAQFSTPSHTPETETHCSETSWPHFITISGEEQLDEIKCSNKFPLFVLVYSYMPDAKLCWVQSGICACGLFSSLSGLDWGTQLTRGCTHLPQTGAMTLVVAGSQRGLLLFKDAFQKQSPDALLCRLWLWILKKKGPTTTNHPPSLRRRHYFGFILQLFVGK